MTVERSGIRNVRRWVPLVLVALIGGVLAWLNGAPWWGWLLVGAVVTGVGLAARLWRRGRWFVRGAAWVAALGIVAAVALAAGPIPTTRMVDGPQTQPVATAQGDVIGLRDDDARVDVFAGIPYAAPPVGDLRWQAPAPALARTEPMVADDFGPSAIQTESSFISRALTRLLDLPLEETLLGGYATDEDSLRLNIWRPAEASEADPRPVLVYLHGGSFVAGSGALPAYDGTSLASRQETVVITLNYRLGVFGFLSEDALGGTTPGNQGLLDQLAALRWVQDNIAAFGGDPSRVTVAGESAGSGSACILGASPLAAGLLHGIIGESGGCLGTEGDRDAGDLYDSAERAGDAARELSDALGGATLAEMRAMPASKIASAASGLTAHWWPSIDNVVLPETPSAIYDAGRQNDVPLLLGSNKDETSLDRISGIDSDPEAYEQEVRDEHGDDADLFLEMYPRNDPEQVVASRIRASTHQSMTAPMQRWAAAAALTGRAPVYTYYFSRTPPDPDLLEYGAYHGAEVMYAYGNLGADGDADYTDIDYRLESEMTGSWIAFTAEHDPNTPEIERWPSVQEAPDVTFEFGDVSSVTPRPFPQAIDYWLNSDG
ncbi:hypothetical protein C5E11_05785 [Clavibacter michiganensis]|nr:carboxylesterase family protein [Clavibacter michiganensis]PPF64197.1 hypothetical protein C5E11_05785 [Clavibacter michiganensis]